jgi:hypothetical protein
MASAWTQIWPRQFVGSRFYPHCWLRALPLRGSVPGVSDAALERDRNNDGRVNRDPSTMTDAAIELAQVDEDILGCEFSDEVIEGRR